MSLSSYYKTLLQKQNPRLFRALTFQETPSFQLLLLARNFLVNSGATYLALVMELEETWSELPGVQARGAPHFPFKFSNEERAESEADFWGEMRGTEAMLGVKEKLGDLFPERGVVRIDRYEETRDALRQMRE